MFQRLASTCDADGRGTDRFSYRTAEYPQTCAIFVTCPKNMDAHVQGKKHLDKLQQQLHPRKEMDDSRKVGDFLKTLFEIPIQIELKGPF
jgi:hypothetical protein